MTTRDNDRNEFTKKEARQRFEDALRGARLAGHKPMESLTRGKAKKQRKPKKKSTASA